MISFKNFIRKSLEPYKNRKITVIRHDRVWDELIREWMDHSYTYTGYYKGLMFKETTYNSGTVETWIKLMDDEGKIDKYPIDINAEFEFRNAKN